MGEARVGTEAMKGFWAGGTGRNCNTHVFAGGDQTVGLAAGLLHTTAAQTLRVIGITIYRKTAGTIEHVSGIGI